MGFDASGAVVLICSKTPRDLFISTWTKLCYSMAYRRKHAVRSEPRIPLDDFDNQELKEKPPQTLPREPTQTTATTEGGIFIFLFRNV